MSMGFPTLMSLFEIAVPVPKGASIHYAHVVGMQLELTFHSPIDLQPDDRVWIDMRTSNVEVVERAGATIWRVGGMN